MTDTSVYPPELYEHINQVFQQADAVSVKRDAVRDIYLDYGFQKSSDGTRGIMPGKDVADLFFGEDGFVRLSWDVITLVVGTLIEHGEYLPYHGEEDTLDDFSIPDEDISDRQIYEEDILEKTEDAQTDAGRNHSSGQLSLFDIYPGPYGEDGKGGDQILQPETEPEEEQAGYMPFPVGSRIAYDDRIFEVLGYLDDSHTAELGDIEQMQGLGRYKVRERLPVVLIENAELLKPFYSEAEVAQTVIQAAEDGDSSEETKKRIENMVRTGQAAEKYAMGLVKEMEQRFRDGTLNYHYRSEHRLYEGGPKAKFRNNVEAIRLLKQLQQENRMAWHHGEDDYGLWQVQLPLYLVRNILNSPQNFAGDVDEVMDGVPMEPEPSGNTLHFLFPRGGGAVCCSMEMDEKFFEGYSDKGASVRGSREDIRADLIETLGLDETLQEERQER